MPFKDILVHVDGSDDSTARLACAIELARTHDAHLSGLYTVTMPTIPMYVRSELSEDILKARRAAFFEPADNAQAQFSKLTDAAGVSAEWRCVEDTASHAIQINGRYTDLIVIGRSNGRIQGVEDKLAEHVILDSPKPVLVVPPKASSEPIGKRILVAWKTSREAVRAIDGAMPFLVDAAEVDVVAVNAKSNTEEHGPLPSTDICHHLARHGIEVEARELDAADQDAANALLKWAHDQHSDLIVMGAYGRWRIREILLGSMTEHILKHTTIPVLLAH